MEEDEGEKGRVGREEEEDEWEEGRVRKEVVEEKEEGWEEEQEKGGRGERVMKNKCLGSFLQCKTACTPSHTDIH